MTFPQRAPIYVGLLVLTVAAAVCPSRLHAQSIITTVAGGGVHDGGPATNSSLGFPRAMAFGPNGDLYFSDGFYNRVFRVDASGTISTVAGTGLGAFSGDNGPATQAALLHPTGIMFDLDGNLLIADVSNNRIRRVVPGADGVVNGGSDETITTIAGTGTSGYSGDNGPATAAQLRGPYSLVMSADGALIFSEAENNVVRKIDSLGTITTVAGSGTRGYGGDNGPATSAKLNSPRGLALDAQGNLYIADFGNRRIRRVDPSGLITTVAGNGLSGASGDGGPATAAQLVPRWLAFDSAGSLYVLTAGAPRVRKILPGADGIVTGANDEIISTVAGSTCCFNGDGHAALDTRFGPFPTGLIFDPSENLLVADSGNARIRKVDKGTQIVSTLAGGFLGDGGPANAAALNVLDGDMVADGQGNLFIADELNHRIRKVDPAGTITTVAGAGTNGFSGDGGPATSAELNVPTGIALNTATGDLFIADGDNGAIRKVDASGTISTLQKDIFGSLEHMDFDPRGYLYVADDGLSVVWRVDLSGNSVIVAGTPGQRGFDGDGGPATAAHLSFPFGAALDAHGNLYIADQVNNRIRRVNPSGTITTVAGNGVCGFSGDGGPATSASLCFPLDVAVDSLGNLYITDAGFNLIRKVVPGSDGVITGSSDEIITTVAGTGEPGETGDGGPSLDARLDTPSGLTVDPAGNLYFGEEFSTRVRKFSVANTPVGQNVPVSPVDSGTGSSPVSLKFSNVGTAGNTTLVISTSGPAPATDFSLGDPPTYYELATTAVFSGTIEVCISYAQTNFGDETQLRLFHFEDGIPVDRTKSLDTINKIICADVFSLSPFAILERLIQPVGLEPPLAALVPQGDAAPLPNHAFKQKSALPIQLQLYRAGMLLTPQQISPPRIAAIIRMGQAIDLATLDLDAGVSNDSGLLFRFSDGKWVYNLSTASLATGTYILRIELPNHRKFDASFVLR